MVRYIQEQHMTFDFVDESYSLYSSEVDALVLFVTPTDLAQKQLLSHRELDYGIAEMMTKGMLTGNENEVVALPTYGMLPYHYVVLAGLGATGERNSLRASGVYVARKASQLKLARIGLALVSPSASKLEPAAMSQALVEGLLLGTYRPATYRQEHHTTERSSIRSVVWLAEAAQHVPLQQGLRIAKAYASGTNLARDLTNVPGNKLVPASLVAEAEHLAKHHGFTIEVLDHTALAARGMGGIVGVGQGSANPPYLITITYDGDPSASHVSALDGDPSASHVSALDGDPSASYVSALDGDSSASDVIALVGKGITFDTGGISLKQASGMEEMISDMGGAATVLGAMHVIGQLRPRQKVIAIIPTAENMPSSRALKPGDVLHMYNGKTVEVTNTDAEGRLILADAVAYAREIGATKIIDVATLTGAISVALGEIVTGAVTNNESMFQSFREAADEAGERIWLLPSYPEYLNILHSDVADLKNAAKTRSAGAITGALFIGEFVDQTPWIHLDIAGTAYHQHATGIDPPGATGVMVRTLATWICK